MRKIDYIAPGIISTPLRHNRAIAASVGGNTGYSGEDIISGGDLNDDED